MWGPKKTSENSLLLKAMRKLANQNKMKAKIHYSKALEINERLVVTREALIQEK